MRAKTSNSDDLFAKMKGLISERSGEAEPEECVDIPGLSFVDSLTS